jgi:hypothetical protein
MRQELRLAPGAVSSGALTVSNDAPVRVRVTADLLDFFIDSSGTPQFERNVAAESEYSCRRWLSLNPMELELDPGKQAMVRYTVRVPADASERGYHCAAGFSTQPTADQLAGMGLRTSVRVVSAFYVVTGKPKADGLLKGIRLEYVPQGKEGAWRAVVVLENRGMLYFRPEGKLEVLAASGEVVEAGDFIPLPVLPRREQNYVFPLRMPAGPGSYTLRARVDLGTHEIQEGTAAVVAQTPVE